MSILGRKLQKPGGIELNYFNIFLITLFLIKFLVNNFWGKGRIQVAGFLRIFTYTDIKFNGRSRGLETPTGPINRGKATVKI